MIKRSGQFYFVKMINTIINIAINKAINYFMVMSDKERMNEMKLVDVAAWLSETQLTTDQADKLKKIVDVAKTKAVESLTTERG
jgi:hypothetical protein